MNIERDASGERFRTEIDGLEAFLTYSEAGGTLHVLHTEVPEEISGQGIGSALVKAAMDHAREHDLKVVPLCPFARSWVRDNPSYARLLRNGGS